MEPTVKIAASTNSNGYAPEVPFGRRDTPETVECLRREPGRVNVNAVNKPGLNVHIRANVPVTTVHMVHIQGYIWAMAKTGKRT